MIKLMKVDTTNFRELLDLDVNEDQKDYVEGEEMPAVLKL